MDYVSLNGQMMPYEEARVSVGDAGLLHGAGLFETMRVRKGKVFRLARHLERMLRSARDLGLPLSLATDEMRDLIVELLEANGLAEARVRITATRGELHAPVAAPPGAAEPDVTLLITTAVLTPYAAELYDRGMMAVVSPYKQNPENPLTGHKTTSHMDRLVALREAQRRRGRGAVVYAGERDPRGGLHFQCVPR